MGYVCDSEDGRAAVVLVTNLGTGDVLAACELCGPDLFTAMANVLTEANGGQPEAATEPTTGDETDDDQAADDPAPTDTPGAEPTPRHSAPGAPVETDPGFDSGDQAEEAEPPAGFSPETVQRALADA